MIRQMDMLNFLLFNGHGGYPWDVGACGCGYQEADLTRECTDRVEQGLRKYGNVYRYPKERNAYQDAEKGILELILSENFPGVKFDYAFERHFNAFNNGIAHGTECFVTYSESGISVEQSIMKRMGKYFVLRDNDSIFDGVKRTNFFVIQTLKNMGVSGALLETCFIDNKDDMKIWASNKVAIDEDIVEGIAEGFGLTKLSTSDSNKPLMPDNTTTQKSNPNRSTGALFTCTGLWTQANGGKWYPANQLLYGKGDYTIGKVHSGSEHPYEALRNGEVVGFANDKCIDDEPSMPGGSKASSMTARQFALEVWNEGKHGTGVNRKNAAKKLGIDPNEAQRLIEILASGGKI